MNARGSEVRRLESGFAFFRNNPVAVFAVRGVRFFD
jgi:hypothetical protein